ncbi:MAG: V-type ATP synthase subunit F [Dehalococcoidales bacterium]|nr:V-type ATP synthase subunit F [Dehalococcoidales bacterium]
MMQIKQLDIVIIGDEDLVSGLRLAGVRRYYIIKDEANPAKEVRWALSEVMDDLDVGVIVILEDYVEHAKDLVTRVRERKGMPPVIVEVPSKYGTHYSDVAGYYKTYIRKSIGFDIEI